LSEKHFLCNSSISASAPGSLMLFGEHAVLQGACALACALNARMQVALTPRQDNTLTINSPLGHYQSCLASFHRAPPFEYVLTALAALQPFASGFHLEITSDFSPQVGLGSSAAVTVATLAAVSKWQDKSLSKDGLFNQAVEIVRKVQRIASGADVAASVFGGIVAYCMQPQRIRPLMNIFDLTVVYSGSKLATAQVIQKVLSQQQVYPQVFPPIFAAMNAISEQAIFCIEHSKWQQLGSLFDMQQGLMEAIGVSNAALRDIVHRLKSLPTILGAKISGSGLGDCAIGMGSAQLENFPYLVIPFKMSKEGVQ
jgi:mevalonate kinase